VLWHLGLWDRGDAGCQWLMKAGAAPGIVRPAGFGHPVEGAAVVKQGIGRERGRS